MRTRGPRLPAIVVLGLGLLFLPAPASRAEDPAPPPTAAAIDTAIDRGVAWVLDEQRGDGTWGSRSRAVGHTALAVFALLHAGLEETAEGRPGRRFSKALAWLDRHGPGLTPAGDRGAATYDTALLLLIECARGRGAEPRVRRLVGILERAQARNGQWSYALPRGRNRADVGDNSNAQFAVLALGTAVGEGVAVKRDVLQKAYDWWIGAAQTNGGYGYSSGGSLASSSIGSMTAAGIASLSILSAALRDDLPSTRVRMRAEDLLAARFAVDKNFGPAQGGAGQRQRHAGRGWQHYFLWSVERAMVLAERETLGTHDWYAEGTAHLLATQKKDGSWRGEHPLYATCFALLFLTRAADPPRVFTPPARASGTVTPGASAPDPAPEVQPGPPPDLGALLRRDPPPTPEEVNGAALTLGTDSLLVLVRALDDPDPKVRQRANETLRALLGDARVGRADRHPLPRGRLRLWIRRNGSRLEAKDGRFVVP